MKPMTLFQPMHRLREWASNPFPFLLDIPQVQADALHVLDRHDLLHRMAEERKKHIWYRVGTEGNGNVAISWQERAEEMERKLEAAKSVLWMAERYSQSTDAKNGFGGPGTPDHQFQAAMEILES